MHIVYFDESGNTGNNLSDIQQPVFMLCALIVPEESWIQIERDLLFETEKLFPSPRPTNFEVHASDIARGTGHFHSVPLADRLAFRDAWFSIAVRHELRVVYRAIVKKQYERWMQNTFGSGIAVNPHVVAFPLVAQVVNDYLKSLSGHRLGIFIFDENKEIARDVEKSLKVLRGIDGTLRLDQIVEKGFFIDSSKSALLQLCDLCALTLRKSEEAKAGFRASPIHQSGIALLEPLVHRGNEAWRDVLTWIADQWTPTAQKKKRPGTLS
ncbi:MAG: DUF3800 domain-containing protein [Planctomycetaceae bacterium]|nr:DUF3800 domain-containing protein [Planctomycetaceae bacterium]